MFFELGEMSMDSLLNKATTSDENPTPGYIYADLIKLTHSDVAICEKMADWLAKRLNRNESAVKWKVLLVMRQVARGGRMEFRRYLQKHSELIKANLAFKGPLDPLRGDEPYRRVRNAAKEVLEAMFDNTPPPNHSSVPDTSRISGFGAVGSNAFPPPAGASPYPASQLNNPIVSTGTMQSYGNYDPNKDKGLAAGIFSKVKSAFAAASTVPAASSPGTYQPGTYQPGTYSPQVPPPAASSSPYPPPAYSGVHGAAGSGGGAFAPATGSRMPGVPGGGWGAASSFPSAGGTPSASTMGGAPAPGTGAPAFGAPRRDVPISTLGGAANDGSYERSLITTLTPPGGLRPVPDKALLDSFLTAARSLNASVVGKIFDERVGLAVEGKDPNHANGTTIALKTLAVIDAIAAAPPSASLEPLRKHLADNCDLMLDILENGTGAVKPSVRQAVYKTLKALGVHEIELPADLAAPAPAAYTVPSVASTPAAAAPAVTTAAPTVASGFPVPAAAPAPVPVPAPALNPLDDIFGIPSNSAPAAATTAQAAAPAAEASGLVDIFGGLSVSNATLTHAAPASGGASATPAAPVAPAGPMSVNAASQVNSAFDNLFDPAPAAPAASTQSATPAPAPTATATNTSGTAPQAVVPTGVTGSVPSAVPGVTAQTAFPAGMVTGMPGVMPGATAMPPQIMLIQSQIASFNNLMMMNPSAAPMYMPQIMALQQQMAVLLQQHAAAASTATQSVPIQGTLGAVAAGGKPASPAVAPAPPKPVDKFDFASADLFSL